jgi:hypothetical protein
LLRGRVFKVGSEFQFTLEFSRQPVVGSDALFRERRRDREITPLI